MDVFLKRQIQAIIKHDDTQSVLHKHHITLASLLPLLDKTADKFCDNRYAGVPNPLIIVLIKLFKNLFFFHDRLLPNNERLEDFTPILHQSEHILEPFPFQLIECFLPIVYNCLKMTNLTRPFPYLKTIPYCLIYNRKTHKCERQGLIV